MDNYLGVMLDCSRNAVMKPKRLKEFIDNKPNGFESYEIRIGGMIERVKRCRKRQGKYLCGKLAPIEELEEKLVETEEMKQGLLCWKLY